MSRKRYLPASPLAPRRLVRFDLTDPDQHLAGGKYLSDRLQRLAREKRAFPSEFDRLVAATGTWCRKVCAEAGLTPDQVVPDELYPQEIWYASQIRSLIAEIRNLRAKEPDLVLGLALVLGELIGEARAHLLHGENAARGLKSVRSARAGHEHVYGTEETKKARWQEQVRAFDRYRAQGHKITVAELLAAEECGVCARTISNARDRTRVETKERPQVGALADSCGAKAYRMSQDASSGGAPVPCASFVATS